MLHIYTLTSACVDLQLDSTQEDPNGVKGSKQARVGENIRRLPGPSGEYGSFMKKRNKKIGKKTQTNSQLTDSPTWVASGETLFLMCGIIGTCDVNAWLKFSESYTLIRPKEHLAVFKKDFMYYN